MKIFFAKEADGRITAHVALDGAPLETPRYTWKPRVGRRNDNPKGDVVAMTEQFEFLSSLGRETTEVLLALGNAFELGREYQRKCNREIDEECRKIEQRISEDVRKRMSQDS